MCMWDCRGIYITGRGGGSGSMLPQGNFWKFLGYTRWYLRPFWTIQVGPSL